MKQYIFMFFCLIFTGQAFALTNEEEKAVKIFNEKLSKNPDDLDSLGNAGTYFYKKKNCEKAIWYWSSPKLSKHPKYYVYKYLQAKCHFHLKEYANTEYYLDILKKNEDKLSEKLNYQVDKMILFIRNKFEPKIKPKTNFSLSSYYGNLVYETEAIKDKASLNGLGFELSRGQLFVDFGYENLTIDFNQDLALETYKQTDLTAGLGYFNGAFKHYNEIKLHRNTVNSDSALSSLSLLYVYKYFFAPFENILFQASHNSFSSSSTETTDFDASQVSLGFVKSITSTLYCSMKVNYGINNYQAIANETSDQNLGSYSSIDFSLGYYGPAINIGLNYTSGQERFFLKNNGFVIQSSTETVQSAYGVSLGLKLSQMFEVSVNYKNQSYLEENVDQAYQNQLGLITGTINI